jgi:hypothetical protein
MAGKARLITVESRNATIDTITATTIARLVGGASRSVTAGAVRRVAMTGHQNRCVRCSSALSQSAFVNKFSCTNASVSQLAIALFQLVIRVVVIAVHGCPP